MKPNRNNQPVHKNQHACAQSAFTPCRKVLSQIDQAKAALVVQLQEELGVQEHLLHLSINEAAALAWQTGYPQLLFPTLAAEKAEAVAKWNLHQRSVAGMHEAQALAA